MKTTFLKRLSTCLSFIMAAKAGTAIFDPGKSQTVKSTMDLNDFESDNLVEATSII